MTTRLGEPLPFLLHFGNRILPLPMVSSRYDTQRCVAQVCIDSRWVDALDVSHDWLEGVSSRTDVRRETTDDD